MTFSGLMSLAVVVVVGLFFFPPEDGNIAH